MEVIRVTRDMIRAIKPLDMEVFIVPTKKACYAARTQVAYIRDVDGYDLKCHVNTKERKVTIKRMA